MESTQGMEGSRKAFEEKNCRTDKSSKGVDGGTLSSSVWLENGVRLKLPGYVTNETEGVARDLLMKNFQWRMTQQ